MVRSLTLKQRRFLKAYMSSGNATQAALVAYDTEDPNTAHAIAAETLRSPRVRAAVAELLDAEGISNRKLHRIHAHFLALYESPDPREQALALRALDMAYKLTGAYEPEARDPDAIFDGWTIEELEAFTKRDEVPERFASRFTRHC